jgi:diacylglycerol kinase family enzyme
MDRAPAPVPAAAAHAHATGPLAIVFNPRSGNRTRAERLGAIEAAARAAGRAVEIFEVDRGHALPRRLEQAVALARAQAGVLVASGGDGTINAAAQAALAQALPFGVLPGGTFNYFARLHGLPLEPADGMRVLLEGRVEPVQVGRVNGHAFLVNASLGLYPQLLEDREAFKQRFGRHRFVAVWAGLATLLRERRPMALAVEAESGEAQHLQASTLFVGNNMLQLERVGLPEAEAVQAGRLAAVIVPAFGRWEMLSLALHGALGRIDEGDRVVNFAFRRLDVQPVGRLGLHRVKVAFDGETRWLRWPLRFEVSPRPLQLLKPPRP